MVVKQKTADHTGEPEGRGGRKIFNQNAGKPPRFALPPSPVFLKKTIQRDGAGQEDLKRKQKCLAIATMKPIGFSVKACPM